MEKKELIKLYLQNVDKMFGYANMNAYIDERLKKYTKYCQSKKPEEQIIIFRKKDCLFRKLLSITRKGYELFK